MDISFVLPVQERKIRSK